MSWITNYQTDLRRYTEYSGSFWLSQFLTQQGLWALLQHRISFAIYSGHWPRLIKRILLWGCVVWQKLIEIITGITIPYTATIGNGLYIGHFGTIILHPHTRMGDNCNLSQGVTIGISGRGERRGVPTIGNRVYIGANAVIVGKIHVGDDVVIGANSLVNRDVPSCCTVLGVPAKIMSEQDSGDYISPSILL
ncbi:MAG: serine acetyltransferase [Chloroflexi bacterium]|nr:serine acetyltransferase [Chloroflexota bacterium]